MATMETVPTQGDSDPVETAEWLDSLRGVLESQGPERVNFLARGARARRPIGKASSCRSRPTRLTSTPFPRTSSPPIPAIARSSGASRASSAGTPWRWSVRANKHDDEHRRPHLHVRLVGHALRSGLQSFFPRQGQRLLRRPDLFSGARLARACTRGPSSKAG